METAENMIRRINSNANTIKANTNDKETALWIDEIIEVSEDLRTALNEILRLSQRIKDIMS